MTQPGSPGGYRRTVSEATPIFTNRLSERRLLGLDTIAAVVLAGLMLLAASREGWLSGPVHSTVTVIVLSLGVGAPLAFRRRRPFAAFAVTFGFALLSIPLGVGPGIALAAASYALYSVALESRRPRREPTVGIAVLSVVAVAFTLVGGPQPAWMDGGRSSSIIVGVVCMGAGWTIGRAVRERRAYAARSAERLAEQAVATERLRIARELHDVVAHNVSVIAVKSGVAAHVAKTHPAEAESALRIIESTSRSTLSEMRQLLGGLRSPEPPALEPVARLSDLPELADRAALAGVIVDLRVDRTRLAEAMELSIYRLVQEAVTNVVKHAAPALCTVTIRAEPDAVYVVVTDDGPGRRSLPEQDGTRQGENVGHGLIGMRERVLAYGGRFTAGRGDGGGFEVSATFPLQPAGAL